MRVDLFDFDLPAELIALRPAKPRDSARLLLVDGKTISDKAVLDLPNLLRPGDTLVFNDTRVIPAQLEGRRGEASIGATLHKREGPRDWWAFVRNAKRLRIGDTVEFGGGVSASVADREEDGTHAAPLRRRGAGGTAPRARRAHAFATVHRLAPSGRSMQIATITRPCSRGRTERSPRLLRPCTSRPSYRDA